MSDFNQSKYIQGYNKEHYKSFRVDLKIAEWEKANKLLKENNMTKAELVRLALKMLENGTLKKEEKDN